MAVVAGKGAEQIIPYREAVDEGRKILTQGRGAAAQERILAPGTVYVQNDRRERKATGSYYTPDYIVKYIVRQTVGPVMDEKLDALRPRLRQVEQDYHRLVSRKRDMEKVTPDEPRLLRENFGEALHALFEIKILDPAMGSGHFLVEAVDYVTDRLVRFLDGFPFLATFFEGMRRAILDEMNRQNVVVDPHRLTDVTLLKRHVLKRCIYGVDLNPMAVELAKVSLWLDCFTLGAPLSFLDHHLRVGNSLIGTMAQELDEGQDNGRQMNMFTGPFVGLLRAAENMRGVSRITDVTLEQVKESGQLFHSFDKASKPFKQLLDIYVAQHFGVELADEFLTVHTQDQALAMLKGQKDIPAVYQDTLAQTRALYEEKRFFHWDLEFPEVFIDLEKTKWKDDGGFDAVIGNPPYVDSENMTKDVPDEREYISDHFKTASGNWDLYIPFWEQVIQLSNNEGRTSLITPNKWISIGYGKALREFASNNIYQIADFSRIRVFEDVGIFPIVAVMGKLKRSEQSKVKIWVYDTGFDILYKQIVPRELFENINNWGLALSRSWSAVKNVEKYSQNLGDLFSAEEAFTVSEAYDVAELIHEIQLDEEDYYKFIVTGTIDRYESLWGVDNTKYLKTDYLKPVVNEQQLQKQFDRRAKQAKSKKILISGIRHFEAFLDIDGSFLAGKSTVIVRGFKGKLKAQALLTILNSSLMTFYIKEMYGSLAMDAGINFTAPLVSRLPIRSIHFTTPEAERERLTAELIGLYERGEHEALLARVEALLPKDANGAFLAFQENATGAEEHSDVVHDLLAHLAEEMIEMNKAKQACVDSFWDDLESVTAPADFEELRNRGKWEQSLAKDAACVPYVDAGSRSTKHIDESLGWDEACFHAFAGMLIGKSSLTPKITAVYRGHHAPYKELVARIDATDDLIDQVVYRLYGLTEEEVQVVSP
jgi:type I restriction-modification system DNA methylase subunit